MALEAVLGSALQTFVEKRCPKAREERRKARKDRARELKAKESVTAAPLVEEKRNTPVNVAVPVEEVGAEKMAAEIQTIRGEANCTASAQSSPSGNLISLQTRNESEPRKVSRYIPIALRDEVLSRDGHRCTYVGSNGVRCACSSNLELDHAIPFARGGATAATNLRTVCAVHNLAAAREVFGREFIDLRIAKHRNR